MASHEKVLNVYFNVDHTYAHARPFVGRRSLALTLGLLPNLYNNYVNRDGSGEPVLCACSAELSVFGYT